MVGDGNGQNRGEGPDGELGKADGDNAQHLAADELRGRGRGYQYLHRAALLLVNHRLHQIPRVDQQEEYKGKADQERHDDAKGRPAAGDMAAAVQGPHGDLVAEQRRPAGDIGSERRAAGQQVDLHEIVELAGGVIAGRLEIVQVHTPGGEIVGSHDIVGLDLARLQRSAGGGFAVKGDQVDPVGRPGQRSRDRVGQQAGVIDIAERRVVDLARSHEKTDADVDGNHQRDAQQGEDKAALEDVPPVFVPGDPP